MKKLITGAVAALALLFGFASCSGDLHDSVVSNLYAEGDFCTEKVGNNNVRLPFVMTKGSDTEQKCEFKYDASKMTAWGGGSGTLNFKITRDEWGWAKDWGGKKDIAVELSVNSQEWLDLEGRDAVNSNPGNIVLKDLADGNTYTLIAKYDAPSEKLSLKCVGAVTDYPILKAVITDDSEGSELTAALSKEVILTRTGKFYESDLFVPTKNGSVSYYLTNGYLYWGADGKMSTSKPTDENKIEGEWTYDENQPTLARKIFVSATNFAAPISDKDPNPKNELASEIKVHDTGILGKADIIGSFDDWKGSSLTYVDATTQVFEFENASTSVEFAIREATGSWTVGRWFKGIPADTADRTKTDMANDIVAAKYGEDATSEPLIYYSGDAGNDGKNAVITGLPYKPGHKFRITVKILDADSKKISVSCAAVKEIPAEDYEAPKYSKVYLAGANPIGWNLGGTSATEAKIMAETTTCKKYYYTFTAESTSLDFKVALDNSWSSAYSNNNVDDGKIKTILDSEPVEFGYANAKNSRVEGLVKGHEYTIVIDASNEKPLVSVVSGKDVLFAIGNNDFGKWDWKTAIMMTPVANGEWKYEFKATEADAQFKFQTTCGAWNDSATWNAKKAISVGGEYVEMDNGGGGDNTSAKLTVGETYILSVKKIAEKYNVKISKK